MSKIKRDEPVPVPSSTPITKGNIDVRELPESGVIIRGNETRITLLYKGTATALKLAQPAKGAAVTGYDGYAVESSQLTPGKGDLAELELLLVAAPSVSGGTVVPVVIRDQYSVDWMRIEKPIETAAFLGDDEAQAAAAIVLDLWRNTEPTLRAQYKYVDTGGAEQTLIDKPLLAAKKILRGVESYLEFAPVVMRIRAYRGRPTTGGCGLIEDPPEYAITGYQYLKTADRLNDPGEGPIIRTEEWTGAIEWDTDLYAAAEAAP